MCTRVRRTPIETAVSGSAGRFRMAKAVCSPSFGVPARSALENVAESRRVEVTWFEQEGVVGGPTACRCVQLPGQCNLPCTG
jgi:hypothetical protein